ncbi:MAG: ABC transporter ATP-binding protein [Candidatus Poribacteria bacterium]|nr:ABC transporter ATP-binding protein [Candidatus Poribacteria bacterium]
MSVGQITLTSVTKQFGETVAVDDVSLQVEGGEFFSLLGPSGCGKTTTLRIIGGFVFPTTGEVRINGEIMAETPPYRRPVNTVFQNYALFPHKTVAQNIAFGLQMQKAPKSEIADAVERSLDLIQLPGYGDRKPNELSGGERQRVALARALINQPTILLLDEPLSALDLKLRKQMQLELKALQRKVGITFVYVTHDQGEALALSDRIAVMNDGKVLQVGTPSEIYDSPQSRFVADFIGTSNFLEGTFISENEIALTTLPPTKIVCTPTSDIPLNTSVTVAVRPERINLTTTPASDTTNLLHGTIQDESYLGTTLQYTVQTDYPIPLIAHQQNTGTKDTHHFRRGDTVYLQWTPENAIVLKAD